SSCGSVVQSQLSPNALTHDAERDEHDCRNHRPQHLEAITTMRVGTAITSLACITILPDHPAQPDLSGSERDAYDQHCDEELPVTGRAVFRDGSGKPPLLANKKQY